MQNNTQYLLLFICCAPFPIMAKKQRPQAQQATVTRMSPASICVGVPLSPKVKSFDKVLNALKANKTEILKLAPQAQELWDNSSAEDWMGTKSAEDMMLMPMHALEDNTQEGIKYLTDDDIDMAKRQEMLGVMLDAFKKAENFLHSHGQELYDQLKKIKI